MKSIVVIVIVALGLYYGYRQGYLKPEWLQMSGSGDSTSSASPAQEIEKTVGRGLPRMVNNEISWDRVSANNVQVLFQYRFVDLDQFAVSQRYGSSMSEVQNAIVRDLCGRKDVRDLVLARGRQIQIELRASDSRTVLSTQVRPGAC